MRIPAPEQVAVPGQVIECLQRYPPFAPDCRSYRYSSSAGVMRSYGNAAAYGVPGPPAATAPRDVDDDQDFAESLAELLRDRGHRVELAITGEEGVRELTKQQFDISFMGVKLPDMSGVDSILETRKHGAAVHVVLMTGYVVEEVVQKAVATGASGVLRKPLVMSEVFSFLDPAVPLSHPDGFTDA